MNNQIESILSSLTNVQRTGDGQWMAKCPAHKDTERSLSVKTGNKGLLFHCFAGCTCEDVCAALGLDQKALFFGAGEQVRARWGCSVQEYATDKGLPLARLEEWGVTGIRRVSKNGNEYPVVRMAYKDADGDEQAVRIRQRLKKETHNGKKVDHRFLWQKGSRLCMYGLWRQPDKREWTLLVEGESDSQTAWLHDLPCLGLPGAANFKEERDAAALDAYETVYLVVEPDRGGAKLVNTFRGDDQNPPSRIAQKMKCVVLSEAKDISGLYHADKGKFSQRLKAAIKKATPLLSFDVPPEWIDGRAATSKENGSKGGRPKTDYFGLAQAYLAETATADGVYTLRIWRDVWYEYNGIYYDQVPEGDVEARIMGWLQTSASAAAMGGSTTRNCVTNVIANLASSHLCALSGKLAPPFWVDSQQQATGWMPMKNAVVNYNKVAKALAITDSPGDIPNLEDCTQPLTPNLFATFGLDYEFDILATCPRWSNYLSVVQPHEHSRDVIAQMMGLSLVPGTQFNVAFFLYGQPGTGKSVFLHVLQHVIGIDNCCSVPLIRFGEKHSTWPLTEKLLNVIGDLETDDGRGSLRHLEGTFKDVTDGGWIPIERKHKDVTRGRVTARCVFATNSLPTFADKTEAMWDRLRIMPFSVRVRGQQQENPYLREEIVENELPGILIYALRGLGRLLQHRKFPEHPFGLAEKEIHRGRCDLDRTYIEENFEYLGPDAKCWIDSREEYRAYKQWLIDGGFHLRSRKTFDQAIERIYGVTEERIRTNNGRKYVYKGINKKLNLDEFDGFDQ